MRVLRSLSLGLASLAIGMQASAASHLWRFSEFYSSPDKQIQFIEMQEIGGSNNETAIQGHWYATNTFNQNHSQLLGTPLPFGTANKKFLVGSQSYAALPGVPAPDYIVPDGIIEPSGDTIVWWFYQTKTIPPYTMPSNGTNSCTSSIPRTLSLGFTTGPNSPRTSPARPAPSGEPSRSRDLGLGNRRERRAPAARELGARPSQPLDGPPRLKRSGISRGLIALSHLHVAGLDAADPHLPLAPPQRLANVLTHEEVDATRPAPVRLVEYHVFAGKAVDLDAASVAESQREQASRDGDRAHPWSQPVAPAAWMDCVGLRMSRVVRRDVDVKPTVVRRQGAARQARR